MFAVVCVDGTAAHVNVALVRLGVRLAASRRSEALGSHPSAVAGPEPGPELASAPFPAASVAGH